MKALQRLLHPLRQRIMFMLARGIVKLSNSSSNMQTLQITVLDGEVLSDVEHFEPYGFTSRPQPGAEVLTASLAGNRSHTVVLCAADRRYRKLNLQLGEVALFTHDGSEIHLKNGGEIYLKAATKLVVDAPLLECTGDIVAAGDVSDATGSMQAMRDVFNLHTHTGNLGNPTSVPTPSM
jgi:phage baseplate assembly protein V